MTAPTDTFFAQQWYLRRTNVVYEPAGAGSYGSVWDDYTGRGVTVAVYDNGITPTHPDLGGNFGGRPDFSQQQAALGLDHGTAVAGVIAAEHDGQGIVGVAHGATVFDVPIWGNSHVSSSSDRSVAAMHMRDFDVVNQSWGQKGFGYSQSGLDYLAIVEGMEGAARNGRQGLGTILVTAAGNQRGDGQGFNDDGPQYASDANASGPAGDSRFAIVVAGVGANGHVADYSTPGANVLISAGAAGAWNGDLTGSGILTTDLQGTNGWNRGAGSADSGKDNWGDGDHAWTKGTSFAAPQVAGIAALMLEAKPNLGYRDVMDILALTARHTGSAIGDAPSGAELSSWKTNHATNWNGGGMHFSNDYGFGMVDARAAIRLAETWTGQKTAANEARVSGSVEFEHIPNGPRDFYRAPLLVPDASAEGISFEMTMDAGVDIEKVQLHLGLHHTYAADLEIWLKSPSGTWSRLLDNSGTDMDINGWTFTSNAFRGESSEGIWTIKVIDSVAADLGAISDAQLDIYGAAESADDLYVYTDEFSSNAIIARNLLRGSLIDAGGNDTINAAAVTSRSIINLNDGAVSTIAGRYVTIDGVIENAFGGDGNDSIYGNAVANRLVGGRGNDRVFGGAGNDVLEGGRGNDSLIGDAGDDNVTGGEGNDTLYGVAGNDLLFGQDGDDNLQGGDGNDVLSGGFATEYEARSGDGDDKVYGGRGDDFIAASFGYDTIDGGAGNDTFSIAWTDADASIDLGANIDSGFTSFRESGATETAAWNRRVEATLISIENLIGGAGDNLLLGDAVGNRIYGGDGNDAIDGRSGNDVLSGGFESEYASLGADGDDLIAGGDGDDLISISFGNDIVDGGNGNDMLSFRWVGADVVADLNATSVIFIESGSRSELFADFAWSSQVSTTFYNIENLRGGYGNDKLTGDARNNVLEGGFGRDTIEGGAGNDTIVGGYGTDTSSYAGALSAVRVDLGLLTAQNTIGAGVDKLSEIENLVGSNFADRLTGDAFANVLSGGDGADTLYGKSGSDMLVGGNGIDNLYGGEGSDTFVLQPASIDRDAVRDFEHGLDRLQISASLFGAGLQAGALSDDMFAANSTGVARDANDRFVYNTTNGVLYFDSNGSASGGRVAIATLAGVPQLTASDFTIVA
jgi:Ca2+-binding RTX toxin-like protein